MSDAPSPLDLRLDRELERLRRDDLYRSRRQVQGAHGVAITVDGRACINFCSNDYLGLAADARLAEAARDALGHSGTGSGAASLVSGYNAEHARLEEELADFLGLPRVLLFASGWAANLGLLRALFGRRDTLVGDELNHASLIDGVRLSGARYVRVPHADIGAFEAATAQAATQGGGIGLVTDAVFSMDGDRADIEALGKIRGRHGATLIVDDAHGFGVLGTDGRGILDLPDAASGSASGGASRPIPDAYVATLGKGLGAAGAFVAGSEALVEYLIQRARTWVFSTAPPPAIAAAARRALRIVREEPERRRRLHSNIARFRARAAQLGIPSLPSSTPIQPLILGDPAKALAISARLFERGYWVAAIRPPTVPAGTSRLRITLSAAHTGEQIEGLVATIAEILQAVSSDARLPCSETASPSFLKHEIVSSA